MNAIFLAAVVSLSGWKGETVNFRYDYTANAAGEAFAPAWRKVPAAFAPRAGVLRPVRYALKPHGTEYGESPDRVEWGGTTNLPPNGACTAVGSLSVPADAQAGDYVFGFADAEVRLHVADRTLPPPSKWKYFTNDLWQNPWSVARMTKTELWSDAHLAACRPFLEMTAKLGAKTILATLSDLPWDHQCYDGNYTMIRHVKHGGTGKWTFDYTVFDKWVGLSLETGNGPYIYCYSLVPWGYAVTWEDETGHPNRIEAKPGTKAFEEYWTPFLVDFREHLRRKGWLENACLSFDERNPEDLVQAVSFISRVAPEFRVNAAANIPREKFGKLKVSFYTQSFAHLNDAFFAAARERRAKGEGVTVCYVCCGPEKPNMFPWSDPDDAFWLAVMPIAKGLDGFGRWTLNSWPKDPYADASYWHWPARDSYLVYPDCSPTWAILQLQNGVQNGEKWSILAAEGGARAAALEKLAVRFDVKQALRKKDGDFRGLIADVLSELSR